ncbi:hypothetical protein OG943_11230 [Amycolatopsis sp. NBC_00345]|uniref:hypothetical protein n=1 Tax=Amycolatopsis sp. NBC_00345 TaxID=2975955 RepID=UPI002E254AA4
MRDLIMSDFLKNLAVPGPAPSGGAVAAVGVAQAAALLARVAGADRELCAEAELLRMHALRLAEKDAHAVGRFAPFAGPVTGGAAGALAAGEAAAPLRGRAAGGDPSAAVAGGAPAASGAGAAALAACLPAADVIAAAAEAVALAERLLPGSGLSGGVPSSTGLSSAGPSSAGPSSAGPSSAVPSSAVRPGEVSPDVAAVAEIARSSAMTARVAIETRLGAVPGEAAVALRAVVAGVDGLAERATWVTAAVRAANVPARSTEAVRVG